MLVIMIMCKLFPKYEKNKFIFCKVVFGLENTMNFIYSIMAHPLTPGMKLPSPPRLPSPATPPSPPTVAPEGIFPNLYSTFLYSLVKTFCS